MKEKEGNSISDQDQEGKRLRTTSINTTHAPKIVPQNQTVSAGRVTSCNGSLKTAEQSAGLETCDGLGDAPRTLTDLLPFSSKNLPGYFRDSSLSAHEKPAYSEAQEVTIQRPSVSS